MRRGVMLALALALCGCGDEGCPPLGSGRLMLVDALTERLGGTCGGLSEDEIGNGLLGFVDCEFGDAHETSADSCEETYAVACYGGQADSFAWLGTVSYAGDDTFEGVLTFRRGNADQTLACEGTYLVTLTNRR